VLTSFINLMTFTNINTIKTFATFSKPYSTTPHYLEYTLNMVW